MRELMSEFKELRLHGMAGAWEELTANGGSRVEASRWLIEHLLQAEHTDRVMRSIGYQMHPPLQFPPSHQSAQKSGSLRNNKE